MSSKEITKGDSLARFEPVGSHFIKVFGHFTLRRDPLYFRVLSPRNRGNLLSHFGQGVQDLLFRKAGPQLMVRVIDSSH